MEGRLGSLPSKDQFEAAFLFSAIGDALGWPTEFLTESEAHRVLPATPLRDFIKWKKTVGGLWWGYSDEIEPGQYSDDTQLNLAVSRCISDDGAFSPTLFAYYELPLWLHYQRGGGRSVKAAARALIEGRNDWFHNFYRKSGLDYRLAGANGAAMRNLPIAMVNFNNPERLVHDSFVNAMITHGHPRAAVGTIMLGGAIAHVLSAPDDDAQHSLDHLKSLIHTSWSVIARDPEIMAWTRAWDDGGARTATNFVNEYERTVDEANGYLQNIPDFLHHPSKDFYKLTGALDPSTKGSGLATATVAIYLFLKNFDSPAEALVQAVNEYGSDTDTISSFLGSLMGAKYGKKAIPSNLESELQDRAYIQKAADQLHAIAIGKPAETASSRSKIRRTDALINILAWEIGLHEMFWDAIQVGGSISHPTLGRGKITNKLTKPIRRQDYVAKLLHVAFDSGQTCVFHSLVRNDKNVSESLSQDITRTLQREIMA
jgi:ADP-ribosylglycohydrolase